MVKRKGRRIKTVLLNIYEREDIRLSLDGQTRDVGIKHTLSRKESNART